MSNSTDESYVALAQNIVEWMRANNISIPTIDNNTAYAKLFIALFLLKEQESATWNSEDWSTFFKSIRFLNYLIKSNKNFQEKQEKQAIPEEQQQKKARIGLFKKN